MPIGRTFCGRVAVAIALLPMSATLWAQPRTDVVTLSNGDRITGEVVRLDRGRLEFKTDDAGTLHLEWDKLTGVVATRLVEAVTSDGRRFFGSLGPAPTRSIAVVELAGVVSLQMPDVTIIRTIGGSFWDQLDGSIDAGYNYTQSSGVAQLNVNSDTIFRGPASQARLTASLTMTRNDEDEDDGRDDRGSIEASYLRYPWQEVSISCAPPRSGLTSALLRSPSRQRRARQRARRRGDSRWRACRPAPTRSPEEI